MIENPLRWPNGARCAVAFTFDMDAESLLHIYQPETAHNRLALSSMLRYGPEVAVPRIVATYRRFGLRQTFFIPGWCIEQYPRAMELILADGHEIAHHGYLHEKPNQLTRAEEHDWLRRAIETITRATGRRPLGYRAPSYAVLPPHAGAPARGGLRVRRLAVGPRHPVPPGRPARAPGRAALGRRRSTTGRSTSASGTSAT